MLDVSQARIYRGLIPRNFVEINFKNLSIMYIHPDARLNGFRAVKIPSNGELLRQFGLKEPSDKTGSNGSNFIDPESENMDNLDMLERQRREINADAEVYRSQSHVSDPDEGDGEDPEPSATSE